MSGTCPIKGCQSKKYRAYVTCRRHWESLPEENRKAVEDTGDRLWGDDAFCSDPDVFNERIERYKDAVNEAIRIAGETE